MKLENDNYAPKFSFNSMKVRLKLKEHPLFQDNENVSIP